MNVGSVRTVNGRQSNGTRVRMFVKKLGPNSFTLFIQESNKPFFNRNASSLTNAEWAQAQWHGITRNDLIQVLGANYISHPSTPRR